MTTVGHRRGGSGEPLVLLHGITASHLVWEPVFDALAEHHDVLALTLPGHARGTAVAEGALDVPALADLVCQELDAHGIGTAHIAGNSLGGWLSLELARRGRARSVVALSPAGCWTSTRDMRRVVRLIAMSLRTAGSAWTLLGPLAKRPRVRRAALRTAMEHGERIPPEGVQEMLTDITLCTAGAALLESVKSGTGFSGGLTDDGVPIRIAWSAKDRTIPFERYGKPMAEAVPHAELVMLPGVGHVPMWDDPALIVRTILDVTTSTTPTKEPLAPMPTTDTIDGATGKVVVHRWKTDDPSYVAVIAHGFAEHARRYDHVAEALSADGATVLAPDHAHHGESDGERAAVPDIETLVDDLSTVIDGARAEFPGKPVVLIGHSMGGLISTRFAQRATGTIDALVLSGPFLGNPAFEGLLQMDPMPDIPLDPAMLSRDPAVGEAYAADPLVYSGPIPRVMLESMVKAVGAAKDGGGFGDLPVLYLHGTNDQLAVYDIAKPIVEDKGGSSLESKAYDGAAHEIFNETNKEEVIGDVIAFVGRAVNRTAPTG